MEKKGNPLHTPPLISLKSYKHKSPIEPWGRREKRGKERKIKREKKRGEKVGKMVRTASQRLLMLHWTIKCCNPSKYKYIRKYASLTSLTAEERLSHKQVFLKLEVSSKSQHGFKTAKLSEILIIYLTFYILTIIKTVIMKS